MARTFKMSKEENTLLLLVAVLVLVLLQLSLYFGDKNGISTESRRYVGHKSTRSK